MKKIAFTLAEVLITLSILGVVAALTIPNVIQKYTEKETVVKLKKYYGLLDAAYTQAVLENGPVESWDLGEQASKEGAQEIYNKIKPYIQVAKDYGPRRGKGFSDKGYKTLNKGSSCLYPFNQDSVYKIVLKDGVALGFWSFGSETCKGYYSNCAMIYVDVNGEKNPNIIGRDLFSFWLKGNSGVKNIEVVPGYNDKAYCTRGTDTYCQNGMGCLNWIIKKSNMDYLHRDVSSEW